MTPHVVIVGADKGGVGKTTISRVLMDYFAHHNITYRAFDTECPNGILKRFHPAKTQVIDFTQSEDQVKVLDTLRDTQVTLLDIRAGLLTESLEMFGVVGFFDGLKEGKKRLSIVHVIGSNKASFDEIEATAAVVKGADHHVVLNHTNDDKFTGLPASVHKYIEVSKLNAMANVTIDRLGVGFTAYIDNEGNSETLRGYTRSWRNQTFVAFDAAALNAL